MDFQQELAQAIAAAASLSPQEARQALEVPPDSTMGDYAFPCFRLAKTWRKAPQMIASELAEKIAVPDFVQKVEVKGAYLNFFLDAGVFAREVLEAVEQAGLQYGSSTEGAGKTIVIDYSSPNIAKPFHVGHLRSTVIGNALYHIFQALGYHAIGINHLGDWGTQFGKLIVAYQKWGSKEAVEEKGITELMRLYVKFHEQAEQTPELEDEARAWFKKMQDGDEEALTLWKWFYDISMKEFERVYGMLHVTFDHYTGESFYNDKMDAVVKELKEKNLLN